jgi:aliphatic nitrilase
MGDSYATIRAAAVQATPVFLDRESTIAKACSLIREAGRAGARFIVFPEGFVPSHPIWFNFHVAGGKLATDMNVELFKNAVEVPSQAIDRVCRAAREANAYVVLGVCEKLPNTIGTLFNTQVFIGPSGDYLGKHQKLMPTSTERLVHSNGTAETFGAVQTDFGPVSGLICGENSNPLAIFALAAEGSRVHAMSWPNHLGRSAMRPRVQNSGHSGWVLGRILL